ncbi:hypothetical protein CR513_15651, partial [Mucuna pruriens]
NKFYQLPPFNNIPPSHLSPLTSHHSLTTSNNYTPSNSPTPQLCSFENHTRSQLSSLHKLCFFTTNVPSLYAWGSVCVTITRLFHFGQAYTTTLANSLAAPSPTEAAVAPCFCFHSLLSLLLRLPTDYG